MSGQHGTTIWALDQVISPVLGKMLVADELDSLAIYSADDEIRLELVLAGESVIFHIWSRGWVSQSSVQVRRRLASELQDFIAESKFGWGQVRLYDE